MSKQPNHPKPEHPENKGQVDLLFQAVSSYSKCKEFKSLLAFCARFKHLSPYNAMLVQMQRPTATYVLTADEWKNKYNRVIKPDARPMIILVPFGPVDFVFDVYDTEPVEKMFPDDIDALMDLIYQSESNLNSLTQELHRWKLVIWYLKLRLQIWKILLCLCRIRCGYP